MFFNGLFASMLKQSVDNTNLKSKRELLSLQIDQTREVNKMKKKNVLVLSSVLALFLAFTIFAAEADALSRRGNDKATKAQTERARMNRIGQSDDYSIDDDSIVNVINEARAKRRFSNEKRTTTASTNCVRTGYAGSRNELDRGFRNCPHCTQDTERRDPALDGSGNQIRKQENNRFDGSGNPDAGQAGKPNNGSGNQIRKQENNRFDSSGNPDAGQAGKPNNGSDNRIRKQENNRFDGSGNPDAGQADRSCDASECLNPDCTATPKRDGTGSRNRGNSTN